MLKNHLRPLLLALLSSSILLGCATSGYRKAEDTASVMESIRGNLLRIDEDLEGVQASLREVMQPTSDGTVAAFQHYRLELQDVKLRFSALEGNLQDVKNRGREYFTSWQKDLDAIQDQDIRAKATQHRAELMKAQDEMVVVIEATRQEYQDVLRSLEDVRIYFSNDLSLVGVDSIRGEVARVEKRVLSLRSRLDEVAAIVHRTMPGFTPAVPASAPREHVESPRETEATPRETVSRAPAEPTPQTPVEPTPQSPVEPTPHTPAEPTPQPSAESSAEPSTPNPS